MFSHPLFQATGYASSQTSIRSGSSSGYVSSALPGNRRRPAAPRDPCAASPWPTDTSCPLQVRRQQGAVKANSRPAAIPNLRHFYLNIPYASLDGAHWQIAVTHYCLATVWETVTCMLLQQRLQLGLYGLSDQFTCSRSQQLC